MSQKEFARWVEFFRLYPFDDLHRFVRPAVAVVNSLGGKVAATETMKWLAPEPVDPTISEVDAEVFRAFGYSPNAAR